MSKDISLDNYYYNEQLKKHIIQFMAIFSGLKVSVGKNSLDSATNLIEVPIVYGSRDRVVSHIFGENTQNKMLRLPVMSATIVGITLPQERLSGQNQEMNDIKLKRGGVVPDDLQHRVTIKPIPYEITMELAMLTSNMEQHFQMLEQIFLLFNPSLQIQVSDVYGNRQSFIEVFLQNVNLEDNYPTGTDDRIVSSSLNFSYVMYVSSPSDLRNKIVKEIQIRVAGAMDLDDVNFSNVNPFILTTEGWDET